MAQKDSYLSFIPGIAPGRETETELWFVFNKNRLLIKNDGSEVSVPRNLDIRNIKIEEKHFLGILNGFNCYCGEAEEDLYVPEKMEFIDLRQLLSRLDEQECLIAGKASQILYWDKTNRYCGRCGSPTENKKDERAKICPECGFLSYPRISPAIIVAIRDGDRILLAHNKNFRNDMYSVIAGFVEPGETFEDCVRREVAEEIGIKVKDIKYFASQPWPFPNSLMVAFTARYDGGEISVDGMEIEHAAWFRPEEFPKLPLEGSIARRLIDDFVKKTSVPGN